MKLKIISNIYGLERVSLPELKVKLERYPKMPHGPFSVLRMFCRSFGYDYIVLNFTPFDVLLLALLKLIIPFNRCRLVTVDLLLTRPISFREKILAPVKSRLLRKVHLFLVLMEDTSGYQRYFHLRPRQFRYLPYKVNALDLISRTPVTDDGYIFCGGKSRRDFKTLFGAAQKTSLPVKIVTVSNQELAEHGSYLNDADAPSNIEIIRTDGGVEPFVRVMAAARLVVIPIKKDIITQAGIAVYLMAMALQKCVIISAGPGVDDVLPDGTAIIIPPEDAAALAAAISKAHNDLEYRRRFEQAGYAYAKKLGGEDRFLHSIIERLLSDKGDWSIQNKSLA